MINRRSLLTGFCGLIAAPAIVRASSLMAVAQIPADEALYVFDYCALRFGDPQDPLSYVDVWMRTTWGSDGLVKIESNHPPLRESKWLGSIVLSA